MGATFFDHDGYHRRTSVTDLNGVVTETIDDRFGRRTGDGALTYGYDADRNRTRVGYPGGVSAIHTHDHADRESTLDHVWGDHVWGEEVPWT